MKTEIDQLRAENKNLQRQMNNLMRNARHNEEKLQRFSEMELLLISTHSLRDLLQIIINNYRNVFDLNSVTLILIDPEYELLRFLDETGLQTDQLPELKLVTESAEVEKWFDKQLSPRLMAFQQQHEELFAGGEKILQSVALIPLIRQGRLIGSLNLGSKRHDRFQQSTSTDFLQRLAAIVSICIENALNVTKLERIGMTDPLTCVYNRRFFERRLTEVVSSSVRYSYELSCMFLDVDRFKQVNDSLGHQVGDLVLREVAGIIDQHLRGSDMVARYGGEEFVVLLPQTPVNDARLVAERIRESLALHNFNLAEGKSLSVNISIGVAGMALGKMGGEVIDLGLDLVRRADLALLEAKSTGRNKVVLAESYAEKAELVTG
ncbi:MAG: sensor domain-containing diguanylate cyclase [Gammaproteobacteria bacterium]|nr:sensor domain-containing diguanylate cyclase [Gammaproteobacteria bacterium]